MSEAVRSALVGTSVISVALLVGIVLTVVRPVSLRDSPARERWLRWFCVGIGLQCFHFLEELLTGFAVRWPELLGLQPWSVGFFVSFNVSWIAVWVWSGVAAREGVTVALIPIWFFAIAMTINLFAHPLLSLVTGAYFPGLVTSPAVGVAGIVLLGRLLAAGRA